ncbi:hypothetical protein BGX34_009513 [Mortierella sp. NVP85]|nr:hypothetical protein BGX34_009513 [Mortierella sp. NVP85]
MPRVLSVSQQDEDLAVAPIRAIATVGTAELYAKQTSGFKDFVPRSQHAMAYDPVKDMVYIIGGTSLNTLAMWDMITYTFATNKWSKITASGKPDPRYGHYAFIANGDLYIYGGTFSVGLVDIWRFNGSAWTQFVPKNSDREPRGSRGSAVVAVTNNNSTKLYVFGGLNAAGAMTRELNVFDINSRMWKRSDHRNSVGLTGATAVYHEATNSIYYFGGMLNHTTRNVVTYQYRISQDLWYALAPRVDPLTATPVPYYRGTEPDPPSPDSDGDDSDGDDSDDAPATPNPPKNTTQYVQPAMFDSLTTVWAPAALMGDDSVVIFGGMRPYGPGVNDKQHSCFPKSFSIYDLSCHKWSTFDAPELESALSGRANHTMILRPPGAAGGSKTAWTAYIFGGFDGTDHGDMLNVTLNVAAPTPSTVNNCRALRWCSLYDDCQYCSSSYCSYVGGLCLFDTDKARNTPYLVGSSLDVPKTGTVQDLINQRPELKSQVLTTADGCPNRVTLELQSQYSNTIQEGEELAFQIYVDAADQDLQFEIRTLPASPLEFKSLNVWEGYMNMYWRADHGLTDGTWDGTSGTSAPLPSDISFSNFTLSDNPVITSAGALNASELLNRWRKYAGLDRSPSTSAIWTNDSYIYIPSDDPRRFSGYYVFSLTNRNPTPITYTLTVTLLDRPHPKDRDRGGRVNMASVALFVLGFILATIFLCYLSRKIRQLIEDREASHRIAEMQLLEDMNEDQDRRDGLHGGMAMIQADGSMLTMKPMYRVVVGVQDLSKRDVVESILRHRIVRRDDDGFIATGARTREEDRKGDNSSKTQPRARSSHISDIGSVPLPLPSTRDSIVAENGNSDVQRHNATGVPRASVSTLDLITKDADLETLSKRMDLALDGGESECTTKNGMLEKTTIPEQPPSRRNSALSSLQRGWSLKSLGRVTSLNRQQILASGSPEEKEALTHLEDQEKEEDEQRSRVSSREISDSEQELMDLGVLSPHTDLLQVREEQMARHQQELEEAIQSAAALKQRRNPNRVQPISVEPLPFHGGLVPRTLRSLKRYQRHLARQRRRQQQLQQQLSNASLYASSSNGGTGVSATPPKRYRSLEFSRNITARLSLRYGGRSSPRNVPTASASTSQQERPKSIRTTRSQGSLKEIHKVASRITLRTTNKAFLEDSNITKAETQEMGESSHGQVQSTLNESDITRTYTGGEDLESGIELQQFDGSSIDKSSERLGQTSAGQSQQRSTKAATRTTQHKPIKMRGREEYEPGPLVAMNYLIVFPGDSGSRRIRQQGDLWRSRSETDTSRPGEMNARDDALYSTEKRLPPMAIGTVFVPDPARWWAYKARQVENRQKVERRMRRLQRLKEKEKERQEQQPLEQDQRQGLRSKIPSWMNLRRPQPVKSRA